ncbi:MAG: 3-phosphoshikimate 1-carboxyvinyltransferase [Conexivisphaera sp.]
MRFSAPRTISGEYVPPPSKSYTHRAMVAAALADGESLILRPLASDDTAATARALRLLGTRLIRRGDTLVVRPAALRAPGDVIDCGGSGTTIRFLSSVASLTDGGYTVLTGSRRLRERPVGPLLDALSQLGVHAESTRRNGLPPVIVRGGGMRGGSATISAAESSQYVSSILLSAPRSRDGVELRVSGIVSRTYVDATLAVMESFGARFRRSGYESFGVEPTGYRGTRFEVPGDYSSASYAMALAAAVGGTLVVRGLGTFPQADARIIEVLENMGARLRPGADGSLTVESDGALRGGSFDLRDSPDLLPVVAVLGALASGRTRITGIAHTRLKESDRPAAMAEELTKLGCRVWVGDDWLEIQGPASPPTSTVVLSDHGDHRIFMSLAVASAALRGRVALAPSRSYAKSYPGFLDDMRKLGVDIIN